MLDRINLLVTPPEPFSVYEVRVLVRVIFRCPRSLSQVADHRSHGERESTGRSVCLTPSLDHDDRHGA